MPMTPPLPLRRRSLLALLAATPFSHVAHATAPTTLRIGIMAGEDEDIWRIAAVHAAQAGLMLKVVTFSDYNAPNEALADHELDANAFQHGPFLSAQIAARGYRIVAVGNTYFSPIGLYSSRWKSVRDLPGGAVIGVPNDPSNEGRALHLLESLGLFTLTPSAGLLPTALDIADNPRNVTIKELDAGMVGRALPDLDAAVVNTDWALKAGIQVSRQRIGQEALAGNPYVNFIAVNAQDEHAPWVAPLVHAFQQPDVRQGILDVYHGAIVPAWG
ncbi:putative D-methionine-binding lipoprotein metQ [Gluconacetobacter diazotrophicus PA1 5]|uniref:Lipoprotein n=2 Tax=Gluconacetobacter diazotrophicus TaxID=33996 RepID=A9HPJ3_GLUDA|nr:putative D-methionine-binding lipoprotein metQ [Gluconacetobacter diazotrophicus PA1 5]